MKPLALICTFIVLTGIASTTAQSALEKYRNLKYPPAPENFDKGWQNRVVAEFEVVNSASLAALRAGLKDKDKFVRSIAARALGIRGDKASADALADLAKNDPEYAVRIRAVESLGLLKEKLDVIEALKQDSKAGVAWAADLSADVFKSRHDLAAQMRQSFAGGIRRQEMDLAKVGQPAPDFTAQTLDGKPFKLSSVLGKKPIALYFAAFDQ